MLNLKLQWFAASFRPALLVALALALAGCNRGESFPLAAYDANPQNLEGNRYSLEADVEAQLKYEAGVARIISVKTVKDADPLGLVIPDSLQTNMVVGQRYRFDITVRKGGLLYVTGLTKL
jgi:hypothetical protein